MVEYYKALDYTTKLKVDEIVRFEIRLFRGDYDMQQQVSAREYEKQCREFWAHPNNSEERERFLEMMTQPPVGRGV